MVESRANKVLAAGAPRLHRGGLISRLPKSRTVREAIPTRLEREVTLDEAFVAIQ